MPCPGCVVLNVFYGTPSTAKEGLIFEEAVELNVIDTGLRWTVLAYQACYKYMLAVTNLQVKHKRGFRG